MRFRFKDKKLEALYTEEKNAHKYPNVFDDFFEVMAIIAAALSERDLYANKGLRLNKQWRLIVTLEEDKEGFYLQILGIEDYH